MRVPRFFAATPRHSRTRTPVARSRVGTSLLVFLVVSTALLPLGTPASMRAAVPRPPTGAESRQPLVAGSDLSLAAGAFAGDSAEAREQSFKDKLTLPRTSRKETFTSGTTKAPLDFSDLAPRWRADTPVDTAVQVEIRTGRDGRSWGPWQVVDEEEVLSPADTPTKTYGSLISVSQQDRTHRYVQSRVTLLTARPGVTPTFHELTYSFINAGVTTRTPRAQVMAMGTPSDIPKPVMVPRLEWGSPEGKSSAKWIPKYKRVTHIVIHHTATSNADTDYPARVRAIWYYHSRSRGWGDIGYNYIIDPNGVIYEGRTGGDDVEAGHAYPFNAGTMGIGILGNYMNVAPSAAAQAALIDLLSWKVSQRGINPLGVAQITGYVTCGGTITYERPTIAGHRDFKGTACGRTFNGSTCPGDRLYDLLPQIRTAVVAEQPPLRAVFIKHNTPGNLDPGAAVDVELTVRNTGSLTWQAAGQGAVTLGYRWYRKDGQPLNVGLPSGTGGPHVVATLPRDVPFADTVTVKARLTAPAFDGTFGLVWDLARDGQGWFGDQGAQPLRLDVVVGKGVGDSIAPESQALPLPVYSNNPEVLVRWAGKDDPRGSGIVSYDIQHRTIPQGPWTDWKSAASETEATFEGQDGYTYGFRSRARDAAGNVEEWREEPDAYTTVDMRPPTLVVDSPVSGAHVEPGPLVVRGRTDPGTFVAVNDKRAAEAGGVFTSTVEAAGRDFVIHVTAADSAGNMSRLELTVQAAPRYNDVAMTHPAFLAIEYLSDRGVVSGYSDGSFKPDAPVTRAQLAKSLATAFRWGLIRPAEPRFTDVAADSWMYPYVETVVARKAMEGYSDGRFKPNLALSRGEAVKTLVLAAGWKPAYSSASRFLDVSARSPIFPYLEAAYRHGVIVPDDEGNPSGDPYFNPDAPATRASVSLMVFELLSSLLEDAPPDLLDDQGPG